MAKCGFEATGAERLTSLSQGQIRVLQVVLELVSYKSWLLLDEPFNHLDCKSISALIKVISSCNSGLIVTVHKPTPDVVALFDRVLIMHQGRLVLDAPADNESICQYRDILLGTMTVSSIPPKMTPINTVVYMLGAMAQRTSLKPTSLYIHTEVERPEESDYSELYDGSDYPPSKLSRVVTICKRQQIMELRRLLGLVDALQLTLEFSIHMALFMGLLKDNSIWSFYNHIGPQYTLNIVCSFRGCFTGVYGEYPQRNTFKDEINTGVLYSKSDMISHRVLCVFLPGFLWTTVYWLGLILVQDPNVVATRGFVIGYFGPLFSYLCGHLLGMLCAIITSSIYRALSLTVLLNGISGVFSGSFHDASMGPSWLYWVRYGTYLFYTQGLSLTGIVGGYGVQYDCGYDGCEADTPSSADLLAGLGYSMNWIGLLLIVLIYSMFLCLLLHVGVELSKSYRDARFVESVHTKPAAIKLDNKYETDS